MKRQLLASTIISARPIVAFVGTMPAVPYGSQYVNSEHVSRLIEAAEIAADQQIPIITVEDDLEARDEASQWMLKYWDLSDDLTDGYEAVKARGGKYLPKFKTESEDEHADRLEMTEFTNVFRDSIETLASKPFEEPVTVVKPKKEVEGKSTGEELELPEEIEALAEDVDGAGNNLTTFAGHVFFNGINSAIHWIYVDYPKTNGRIISKAQAKQENIRPFWSHVLGRNVLEARVMMIGGKETLIYIRILEPGSPNHIRIFNRYPDGQVAMGLYEQRTIDGKKKEYVLVDAAIITIGEIPLVYFATGRRDGRTFKFAPPMRDAADLQVKCYQKESGLCFSRTLAGYPMLAGDGITPEKEADGKTPKPVRIGPARVLFSPPNGQGNHGSWGYISPDPAVMKFLKDDIKDTQEQLRELGRQPLTAQSNNLTVITTAYAAGKAKTACGAWAYLLQDALENGMRLSCLWLGITEDKYEPEIKVFTDFDDFATDQSADLTAIQAARDKRDLSQKNYHRELKRRGTLRAEFDTDENTRELLEETPSSDTDLRLQNDGALPPEPGEVPKKPQPPKKPGASA